MGRKAKYFTEDTLQPYVDIALEDLGLTDKINSLVIRLGTYTTMNADIEYNSVPFEGSKYSWCTIRINRKQTRRETLRSLLHEMKHLEQYYNERLAHSTSNKYRLWKGKQLKDVRWEVDNAAYMKLPWEVEAFAWEDEVDRLFPNAEIITKKLVGVVGKVKFYKISA